MQEVTDDGAGVTPVTVEISPPALPTVEPAAAEPPESHPFRFTGTTGGFFAIWIVNLFLTIITLGIYSAWAKVRKKRYFYGHTWVADANFEYHGNPIAILKGRLIAVAAFAAYSGVGHFMPKLAAALALLLFAAAPWFIARSMAFNAFNSSYRNIRFRFQATYTDVLKTIWPLALPMLFSFLLPELDQSRKVPPPTLFWAVLILQMLTFFAVYPFIVGSLKVLHVNHSAFGTAPFHTGLRMGAFYKIYSLALLLFFGAAIGFAIVGGLVGVAAGFVISATGVGKSLFGPMLMVAAIVLAYFGMGSLVLAYTRSRIGNLVFNSTRLGGQLSFTSTLKMRKLAWLYLVNLFAVLFSLGLAIPWAAVRVMRYRADCLTLQSTSPLDEFIGGVSAQVGATGEELGEFFNIDLSL